MEDSRNKYTNNTHVCLKRLPNKLNNLLQKEVNGTKDSDGSDENDKLSPRSF